MTAPAAAQVRVPGNTLRGDFGAYTTVNWAHSYLKLQGVDTLDYVQDATLGASGDVRIGGAIRDEEGLGTEVQPVLSGSARTAFEPLPSTYITLAGSSGAREAAGAGIGT